MANPARTCNHQSSKGKRTETISSLMQSHTFPKRKRLSSKKDIDRVFNKGFFISAGLIRVRYVSSAVRHNRFLVSVSRKAGHSPKRNRIKRLIREAVRLRNSTLKNNYDICLFVTKAPRIALTFFLCRGQDCPNFY